MSEESIHVMESYSLDKDKLLSRWLNEALVFLLRFGMVFTFSGGNLISYRSASLLDSEKSSFSCLIFG